MCVCRYYILYPATCGTTPPGLFLAPQTTGEALKGGRLVAEVLHREGFKVVPVRVRVLTRRVVSCVPLAASQACGLAC